MLDLADKRWLQARFGPDIGLDIPLAPHTTFRVGGPAEVLATPSRERDLADLLAWAHQNGIPCTVIGGGSNLLIADQGIAGLVILLTKSFKGIKTEPQGRDSVRLFADGGMRTRSLCAFAVKHRLDGFQCLVGIPGTLGGAVQMNAGNALGAIADIVAAITVLTRTGEPIRLRREDLSFRYRGLALPAGLGDHPVVTGLWLTLRCHTLGEGLRSQWQAIWRSRLEKQPRWPSAGCFFKNPPGYSAGALIDRAGLKGERLGDAQVSAKHANFIVNRGRATAGDILALADRIGERVRAVFGIRLIPEVRVLGT